MLPRLPFTGRLVQHPHVVDVRRQKDGVERLASTRTWVALQEVPPRHPFILAEAPLVARGEEDEPEDPGGEQRDAARVDVELLEELLEGLGDGARLVEPAPGTGWLRALPPISGRDSESLTA
jgi:hypothetical protein